MTTFTTDWSRGPVGPGFLLLLGNVSRESATLPETVQLGNISGRAIIPPRTKRPKTRHDETELLAILLLLSDQ